MRSTANQFQLASELVFSVKTIDVPDLSRTNVRNKSQSEKKQKGEMQFVNETGSGTRDYLVMVFMIIYRT